MILDSGYEQHSEAVMSQWRIKSEGSLVRNISLHHADANVEIKKQKLGKSKITVNLLNESIFMPHAIWETSYPISLIEKILDVKGPAYLCDEIMRDESDEYVRRDLKMGILSYVCEKELKGKRILDFGCGCGASTMVLGRLFPEAEILGVEQERRLIGVAELRKEYYNSRNIDFMVSINSKNLPDGIGTFDYINLSAVYEHLLPDERECLLPQIWKILEPGGILFINQTPDRRSPVESHTSGLPLINYLPDKMACYVTKILSPRKLKDRSWDVLLRSGIRGGTDKEILKILTENYCEPILLSPSRLNVKDRIDLWYRVSNRKRWNVVKLFMLAMIRLIKFLTSVTIVPSMSLAIKKRRKWSA